MPIYEYKCKECGAQFEEFQNINDSSENVICPECGEKKTERIMSAFASFGSSAGSSAGSSCIPRTGFS